MTAAPTASVKPAVVGFSSPRTCFLAKTHGSFVQKIQQLPVLGGVAYRVPLGSSRTFCIFYPPLMRNCMKPFSGLCTSAPATPDNEHELSIFIYTHTSIYKVHCNSSLLETAAAVISSISVLSSHFNSRSTSSTGNCAGMMCQ